MTTMPRRDRGRRDAFQLLYDRYIGDDPERVASFQRELANAEVARDIYRLRTEAGLTQREPAERVGTTASVICRLEDADYDGHSLSMLRRVAAAVGRRVEVRFPRANGAGRRPARALPASAHKPGTPDAAEAAAEAPARARPPRGTTTPRRGR